MQRQTAVSAYLKSKQLLLFAFAVTSLMQLQTAVTAYFWRKQLLLFVFSLPYLSDDGVVRMADDWQVTAVPVITLAAEAAPVDANAADAAAPTADGGDEMLLLMLLPFVTSAIT